LTRFAVGRAGSATGKPRVFILQGVPDAALGDLRSVASVEVFSGNDRTISRDELLTGIDGCHVAQRIRGIGIGRRLCLRAARRAPKRND
jgi:hypothetical protein